RALAEPRPAGWREDLERRAAAATPRDFRAAILAGPEPALIAECKRTSPVRGRLEEAYDVARRARAYAAGGASALSILTNADFEGSLADLETARAAVDVPLLRKDFVLDPVQLLEARAGGADMVLLIVRILDAGTLRALCAEAHRIGLQVLIEIHAEAELEPALAAGPDLLGVNHRDLATFEVEPTLLGRIAPRLPPGLPMVAESGLRGGADVLAAHAAGARAVLVGETLMRAADPEAMVRQLLGG
ncbi:MAG TPA: indole-3-glycerol phosphate synthase TrpC, partial [Candidatus Dormibacteraeota bacterium]|nr:indole-3-glycerol phosphate synthase TrpC [Candidatus Dormibacteraeota bacterium]